MSCVVRLTRMVRMMTLLFGASNKVTSGVRAHGAIWTISYHGSSVAHRATIAPGFKIRVLRIIVGPWVVSSHPQIYLSTGIIQASG